MPARPTVWRMRSGPSCRDWGNADRAGPRHPWPTAAEGVAWAALRPGARCRVAHTAARTAGITSRASRCACSRGSGPPGAKLSAVKPGFTNPISCSATASAEPVTRPGRGAARSSTLISRW